MNNLILSANVVGPLFILLLVGNLLKRMGYFSTDAVNCINKLVYSLLIPANLFYNIYTCDLKSSVDAHLIRFAVCAVLAEVLLLLVFVSILVKDRSKRSVIIQGSYRSNFVLYSILS